jgi:cytochrome c553
MTKAQIWIAAFVGLFILLYAIEKLSSPTEGNETTGGTAMGQQATADQGFDPKVVLGRLRCTTCHGADLRGSGSGPSLAGLTEVYTTDKLVAFLKDPTAFAAEPRHRDRAGKYPSMMPSFKNRPEDELNKIAAYILSQK